MNPTRFPCTRSISWHRISSGASKHTALPLGADAFRVGSYEVAARAAQLMSILVSISRSSHFPRLRRFSRVYETLSRFSGARRGRQTRISIIPLWLQRIERQAQCAFRITDSSSTPIQNMGVNDRCAEIPTAQEFLGDPDVITVFEEMRCKGVPNGVVCPGSPGNSTALGGFSRPKGPSHALRSRSCSLMSKYSAPPEPPAESVRS